MAESNVIRDIVAHVYGGRYEDLAAAVRCRESSVRNWMRTGKMASGQFVWRLMQDLMSKGVKPLPTYGQLVGEELWGGGVGGPSGSRRRRTKAPWIATPGVVPHIGPAGGPSPAASAVRTRLIGTVHA